MPVKQKHFWKTLTIGLATLLSAGEMYLLIGAARSETGNWYDPEFEETRDDPASADWLTEKYGDLTQWQRPNVPLRIGLQVGHWKNSELPDELEQLRGVSTGAEAAGYTEWKVMMAIAEETKKLLEQKAILVDLLPATLPPEYWADALIALHADGNDTSSISGYKLATPRRDLSRRGQILMDLLTEEYGRATKLGLDENITRNMRGYYAFNYRRYQHAIHPMTPAVILETGFLTSPHDRRTLVGNPALAAAGISEAIMRFLQTSVP